LPDIKWRSYSSQDKSPFETLNIKLTRGGGSREGQKESAVVALAFVGNFVNENCGVQYNLR